MKKFIILLLAGLCLQLQVLAQQSIDIKGRVITASGEPAQASLTIRGTKTVTLTNDKGEFAFKGIASDAILLVEGVTIQSQRISINGRTELLIRVQPLVKEGEEVVVANTGYQTIRPNEMNGSVVVIDAKQLNQQTGTNILQRLDGITSGLQFNIGKNNRNPSNNTNISIRGLSTINGPLDPLIILDGFIYEGDIANIHPNDIETITILKDASAASIWGARAGNGVIVLTTKKGRVNQPMQVTVNSNIIIRDKPDLSQLPQVPSSEYIAIEQFLFQQGYFDNQINYEPYRALTPGVEIFRQRRLGLISAADSAAAINTLSSNDARDDYERAVYRTAITQQYGIQLRGGQNNHTYTFGANFDKSISDLRSEFRKINVMMENAFRPTKNLQFSIGAYYTNSHSQNGMPGYGNLLPAGRGVPYYSLLNADGSHASVGINLNEGFTDTLGAGKLLDWRYYPLDEWKQSTTKITQEDIYVNLGVNYRIISSLTADLKYQYQRQQNDNDHLATIESFEARNMINTFSQVNYNTGAVKYNVPLGGIRGLNQSVVSSQTIRGQLNFQRSFGQHSLTAIAGGELREAISQTQFNTIYGYNADPLMAAPIDPLHSYPDLIYGYSRTIPYGNYFQKTNTRFVSVYANAGYSFRNRYNLSGSMRRDGSNIFGVKTNDRWKPLWSVGAGWNISKESFYSFKLLPELRLRITYGRSGNVDPSRTALPIETYFRSNGPFYLPAGRINTINNPELRWEQSGQVNYGVDFAFRKQRITGSIDYWRKKGTDLYGQTPYDYTTFGMTNQIIKNVAGMRGTGFDVILNSNNIEGVFRWNTQLLFNYNTNKTTEYYDQNRLTPMSQISGGSTIIGVMGLPLYGIVAYKWGGLDNMGNPQGYLNGALSTDYNAIGNEARVKGFEGGIKFIGTGTPKYFGSLINNLEYRNWRLSINIAYKFDYYFTRQSLFNSGVIGGFVHSDWLRRWQNPGDENHTEVPSFQYPNDFYREAFYTNSEINILRADHVRLQYINLSYSISRPPGRRIPFENIEVYGNAANLGILWRANDQSLDPDYAPAKMPTKSWTVGLRANF